ncbi:hypothetical protein Ciccas_013822, partial [Cichlidogyrus casuarinus]
MYYFEEPSTGEVLLRDFIPATFCNTVAGKEVCHVKEFPYSAYLKYWSKEMQQRIEREFGERYGAEGVVEDPRDVHLMEEFLRSVVAMPLESSERRSLIKSLTLIKELAAKTKSNRTIAKIVKGTKGHIYEHLGELQVKGASFWKDANRYAVLQEPSLKAPRLKTRSRRLSMETVNPFIPTCWFAQLPHQSGYQNPVGNPISKSFIDHIYSGRLHSDLSCESDIATDMLRSHANVSFWQGYCKRINDQICIWTEQVPGSEQKWGAILPQVIVAGTVSRRAVEPLWLTASNAVPDRLGSEVKSMVQSPPGYRFVGADVDSQEMWIAALIGDSSVGFQ